MYKVIVYLTTGKILIQGKFFQQWCSNEFEKTLKIVEKLSSSSEMTTPKSLQFEIGEDDYESSTNHHTIRKNAHVNEIMEIQSKNSGTLSKNSEIVSTNSEILQEEDQIKLKTPPEKVPITPVLQAKMKISLSIQTQTIVYQMINIQNPLRFSRETLKQVQASELKMLREKIQESDIDKKKIIENFEIEKCQLTSKAKELERNSYQTNEVFQAAEEKLQNMIIVLTEKQTELEILLHENMLTCRKKMPPGA
ncbi:unnamed protein product [Mytilus edulis]|uniref:Uncharacterized protein n=1 Tax=Mytilus edulis TaxID=6550 RepID=A0A8S3QK58_MYTED|nr:unnamed protein product [Mytilus edulis]